MLTALSVVSLGLGESASLPHSAIANRDLTLQLTKQLCSSHGLLSLTLLFNKALRSYLPVRCQLFRFLSRTADKCRPPRSVPLTS